MTVCIMLDQFVGLVQMRRRQSVDRNLRILDQGRFVFDGGKHLPEVFKHDNNYNRSFNLDGSLLVTSATPISHRRRYAFMIQPPF
jgi:hypothetical protein